MLDIVLLTTLVFMAAAGCYCKSTWIRRLIVLTLLLPIFAITLVLLAGFDVRSAAARAYDEGTWSQDFVRGLTTMSRATKQYLPYVLVCSGALAILAMREMRSRPK